jgi:hypothetical protein
MELSCNPIQREFFESADANQTLPGSADEYLVSDSIDIDSSQVSANSSLVENAMRKDTAKIVAVSFYS